MKKIKKSKLTKVDLGLKFLAHLLLLLGLLCLLLTFYLCYLRLNGPQRKKISSINLLRFPSIKTIKTVKLPNGYPLLLINLSIDRLKSKIEVKSIKKGFGFSPDYKNPNMLDFLTAEIEERNQTKKEFLIPLPIEEVYDQISKEGKLSGGLKKLDKFSYSVILPLKEESAVYLKKDFIKGQRTTKSINTFKIPKLSTLKQGKFINVSSDKGTKSLPLEELTTNLTSDFYVETIFDGNPSITDPARTLDIVFVSSGFAESEFDLFRDFSKRQADALIGFENFPGKEPFSSQKRVIKIRQIISPLFFHSKTSTGSIEVQGDELMKFLVSIGVPFDQFALVLNEDGRSWASLGGMYCVLFRTWVGPERNLLFTHELAHSFGAVLDEYIEEWGVSSDLPDNRYGRNCKEDPSESWLENQPGGAFLGCNYYWNLYRPENSSLMVTLSDDEQFNAPSKFLLLEAFRAYTQNEFAIYIYPARIRYYKEINKQESPYQHGVGVANLGTAQAQFRASLSPNVSWIINQRFEGRIPGYLEFEVASQNLNTKGTYETNLIIEILTQPPIIKNVPITVFVGDRTDPFSLSIIRPTNGEIINQGNTFSVGLDRQEIPPGFKRIEYYYKTPEDSWDFHNGSLFNSRTIAPFEAFIDTKFGNYFYNPGDYQLWAKGVPFFGNEIESNRVEIELAAFTGTNCYNYRNKSLFYCVNEKSSHLCFRGAEDCQQQNLTYCCPQPSPTPAVITLAPPSGSPLTSMPTPAFRCYLKQFLGGCGETIKEGENCLNGDIRCQPLERPKGNWCETIDLRGRKKYVGCSNFSCVKDNKCVVPTGKWPPP